MTVLTEASQSLFEATNQRAYFGQIKIVIPETWELKEHYRPSPSLAKLLTYITVSEGIMLNPHVLGSSTCGKEGEYFYLTPNFILTEGTTDWGPHANVIVHEWGHLRWGLFDEYPSERDKFYLARGEWKPVRCSETIQGRIGAGTACGEEEVIPCNVNDAAKRLPSNCNFCADPSQDVKANLMGYQFINKISSFCDDSTAIEELRHNRIAPNDQNYFCRGQSAWEVMRSHEDFIGGANPPMPPGTNTKPDFVLKHETSMYIVFVLDVSGSMSWDGRIEMLNGMCKFAIQEGVLNGFHVGIVWFNDTALLQKNLTQVNSQQDRDGLVSKLPTYGSGGTCIGCGINKALEELKAKLTNPENGQIILVSDGKDNLHGLNDSLQNATDAHIVVHTMGITTNADSKLQHIAAKTGGQYYNILGQNSSNSFVTYLNEIITTGATTISSAAATVISKAVSTNANETISFEFKIDSGIGIDTKISILADFTTSIKVELSGPNGYTQDAEVIDISLTLKIKGQAEAGKYSVNITVSASSNLECYVTSKPVSSGPGVIRLLSKLSTPSVNITSGDSPLPVIYGTVIMSYAPIVKATVIAEVTSDHTSCIINLLDDGNDPDIARDDGTYSGYIQISCMAYGTRASVKVLASSDGNAKLGSVYSGSYSIAGRNIGSGIAVDAFQRVALPGDSYIIMPYIDTSVDITAPGRITNVQIVDVSTVSTSEGENRNYTITWTATGDDMNVGQATSYELRISENFDTLVDKFTSADFVNITSVIPTPLASGETEALKMVVNATESYTSTAYFAIVAIDDEGNRGRVSNIVSINIATQYKLAVAIFERYNTVGDTSHTSPPTTSGESSKLIIYVAVAIPGGLTVCIIIGVVLVYKTVSKKEDNLSMPDREIGPNKSTFITTSLTAYNCTNELFIAPDFKAINDSFTTNIKSLNMCGASDLNNSNHQTINKQPAKDKVSAYKELHEEPSIDQQAGKHTETNMPIRQYPTPEPLLDETTINARQDHSIVTETAINVINQTPNTIFPISDDFGSLNSMNSIDKINVNFQSNKKQIKQMPLNKIAPTPEPMVSFPHDVSNYNSLESISEITIHVRPGDNHMNRIKTNSNRLVSAPQSIHIALENSHSPNSDIESPDGAANIRPDNNHIKRFVKNTIIFNQ